MKTFLLVLGLSSASGHERMLALLEEIREQASDESFFLGSRPGRELRERLAAMGPEAPEILRWEVLVRLAEAEQILGKEQAAIDLLSEAYAMLPRLRRDIANDWILRLLFRLGIAHLRQGETRNCALQMSPEACILPIRGGGIHADKEPSRRAIQYLEECIEEAEKGSDPDFSARWVMNLAYMTLGEYPDKVPREFLIPPEVFASDEPFRRFQNVAHSAGVATFSLAGGAVSEDFDRDGDLDLLVSTFDPAGQLRLFLNAEDGTFSERTEEAHLEGLFGGLNMVQADYDDDGDADVLVMRGGWLGKKGIHPPSLLRNNGDGTFTDVTFEMGLGEEFYPSQAASWADFDRDGDLDVYIGRETTEEVPNAHSQLFENRGDRFVDVAKEKGVENLRFAKAVIWGDYDADGFADLYVSNIYGKNRLYHNEGGRGFVDVAERLGVDGPRVSFPSWFWDFDNDGALDLYVAAYDASIGDLAAFHLGLPFRKELARLYRGDGKGGFRDVAPELNLTEPSAPMGVNFGDLDGDGFLDFYLGTGSPPYHALMPNVMYWNRGGTRFANVTADGGFGNLQKGHGVVFADLDGDGDQDVYEQMGGHFPGDKAYAALYENPGFGNRFLDVEVFGRDSNRSAIGARLRIRVVENGASRDIYKYVNSGANFGANPFRQQLGLGKSDRIEVLEVTWPRSGVRQEFRDVPLDASVQVLEGSNELRVLVAPGKGPR
jgi:hypothetical protein